MIQKLKNLTPVKIVLLSFSIVLAIFLISTSAIFLIETAFRLTGKIQTITLDENDFELISIVENENGLVSSDADPQLIRTEDMYITSITMDIEYSLYPGEVTLYYTTKSDQGFSSNNRAWFTKTGENTYTSDLFFMINSKSIRIDPTDSAANFMDIKSITINEEKSFFEYFSINQTRIYHFMLYSLLLSSTIAFLREVLIKIL